MQSGRRSSLGPFPVWSWLALLVAASAAVRFVAALAYPAPWILDDELIQIEAAKAIAGFADSDLRDVGSAGLYFVYPTLIAPALALFDDPAWSYRAIKAINALVMSSAAVPAFLIARRVLDGWHALVVALLALAVPSMVYTAAAMTENAYYPAFLWAVLAMLRSLERPSAGRQLAALAAIALAFFVRNQAAALLPAYALALVSRALLERDAGRGAVRRLLDHRLTWTALALPVLVVAVLELAGVGFVQRLAGQNSFVFGMSEKVYAGFAARLPSTLLAHVADLDLYVGVLPFAAFVVLVGHTLRRPRTDPAATRFAWTAAWVLACNLLLVAGFLALVDQPRIADRNLFVVTPLLFVALLHWLSEERAPGPWTLAACLVAGLLPLVLDLERVNRDLIAADSLALLAVTKLDVILGLGPAFSPVLVAATVAASLALLLGRGVARLLPAAVLGFLVAMHAPVVRATAKESRIALAEGVPVGTADWIDRQVGPDADVALLWHGTGNRHAYWQTAFFNRSVDEVFGFYGWSETPRTPGQLRDLGLDRLPTPELTLERATGRLLDGTFVPFEREYVLVHDTLELDAPVVARDEKRSMVLYALDGPARVLSRTLGVSGDGWTGKNFVYSSYHRDDRVLELDLHMSDDVHATDVTVVARNPERELARTVLEPGESRRLFVRVPACRGGVSRVKFEVSGTAKPAYLAGRRDARELGVVCTRIESHPMPELAAPFTAGVHADGWTQTRFEVAAAHARAGRLRLGLWSDADREPVAQHVAVFRDEESVAEVELAPGEQEWLELPLGPCGATLVRYELEVSPPYVPDASHGNGDRRELGVLRGPFLFTSPGELLLELDGVHHDRWTEPRFVFELEPGVPGTVTLHVASNPKVFPQGQRLVAELDGERLASWALVAGAEEVLRLELPGGESLDPRRLRLTVEPTSKSPGAVGDGDPRDLGLLLVGAGFAAVETRSASSE